MKDYTPSMFDTSPLASDSRTMSRASDPAPSHEAAAHMVRTGAVAAHHGKILAALAAHPDRTAHELGDLTGLGQVECARRLSELKRRGHVIVVFNVARGMLRLPGQVYRITDSGRKQVRNDDAV